MKFKPTDEQRLAINTKGSVLVSAAAGSGKTAVLVERVIKLLCDVESPVMANRLLIVTFTNLAASELRSRIEERLQEEINANPQNHLLQKQKILLSAAHICTIDSFCIDFIKENFELTGINPSFKIADNASVNHLKSAVIDGVFKEYFENKDTQFLNLIYLVGAEFDDKTLMDFVTDIFDYSRQMPYPSLWLNNIKEQYLSHAKGENSLWFDETLKAGGKLLFASAEHINRAVSILSEEENAFNCYKDNYLYLGDFLNSLIILFEKKEWDNIYTTLEAYNPPSLKRLKSSDKTELTEKASSLRKTVLENIKAIKGLIYGTKSQILNQLNHAYPYIEKLIEIITRFQERFYTELNKRNLMTFYMCEQEALAMLTEVDGGTIKLRPEASEYIAAYDAVLVDEYQDTNDLQDRLFSVLSDNSKKLFCVGDVKQSIYRFRGANPYNFLNRKESGKQLKIDLGCNFRSRDEICEFVNSIFKNLMFKENSGFDCDDNERLVPKAVFPKTDEPKTEIHITNLKNAVKENDLNQNKTEAAAVAEANIIADIIFEKMNAPAFIKSDDKTLRKASFEDFAILCRSLSTKGYIIAKTLKSRGIPVSVDFGGLLETDEVKVLISFLKVINNPGDDISLLTLLTSPIFAFKIDQITEMRLKARNDKLIRSILLSAAENNEMAKTFLETLTYFTDRKIMFDISGLIEEIFEKTNFLNIVSRQAMGEEKRRNLLSFQRIAAEADEKKTSLRSFLQTIDSLSSQDFKKPNVFLPNSVKLMTVHASKGLQFPVCILADAAHQFNMQDINSSLILDEMMGFAFKFKETEWSADDNILRNLIKIKAKKELLAEELRLLYVALTRAEDKLIISATTDDICSFADGISEKISQHSNENRIDISAFKSYFEFILASIIHDFSPEILFSDSDENLILPALNLYIHNKIENTDTPLLKSEKDIANKDNNNILKSYDYVYPFEALREVEAKASVTEIVHKADKKKYEFSSKPAFLLSKGLSGAEKGTATHKFMQFCDIEKAEQDIDSEIFRLYDFGYLTDAEAEAIEKDEVLAFFSSELYCRIKNAKIIKREERFLTEFPATELDEKLDKSFSDEMIIVQGAVDLVVFEEDGIVIVDFKTDRNQSEKELLEAYSMQLKMYALAIQKLYNIPIKEMLIYSFALKKAIKV